ncbi:flavin oxidoreductase [Tenacibaculum sp. SZ-18]|uniref:flavin reductase family protein n=1 Tax=Tenacibaculum sp. SZ-18 TaxID=754423 RepID=UPI000C2CEC97|nr:flavin reductase [Tenacibaculum sp. SZ-18]AUC14977.1 flavin oxidoreductase [Tenacibaculum sp. SZ-18]
MKYFDKNSIANFDKIHRINLMNSLSGYKSANLLGTVSNEGFENVAVFSSIVHLGSNPPVLGFILRPTTVPRNTYENIINTGYYTVNHITEKFTHQAHHTSAKYNKLISEFDMTGLTPEYKKDFHAPFVKESPVQIGLKFLEEYHIKANDTLLVVGEIQCFYVNEVMYDDRDGFLDLSKGNVATINGLDAYAIPKNNTRYEYQRPKKIEEKA